MNTEEALEESIQKWVDIAEGEGEDRAAMNCALCEKFLAKSECEGCPVMKKTGKPSCVDSPFRLWIKHHRGNHSAVFGPFKRYEGCSVCTEIAREEVRFLKSLRK